MAAVLGIDLGTTNSVVCVAEGGAVRALPDEGGHVLIPSVVSFHPSGDVIVGQPARERRLLDARNTVYSIKRLIGRPYESAEVRRAQERFPFELCRGPTEGVLVRARGETYALPEISALVLREVRRIAELGLRESCTQAVVTVPANFNELQRSATKAAARVAGLDVVRILNEPTAAALAYGYGKGARERIAVFDFGGGTFDITILDLAGDVFEVLATAGDTFLGGDDIDLLVAEKMADAFLEHHRFDPRRDVQAFERLRSAAEWAKCQLSSEREVQLRIEELAYGEAGASLDLNFGMTRRALEGLARPLIERTFDVCEDAMRIAGIRPMQLDNVVLVGGSTRIPLVRELVEEYFGRQPLDHIDPDLVVAHGAALQAAALSPIQEVAMGIAEPPTEETELESLGTWEELDELDDAPTPVPVTRSSPTDTARTQPWMARFADAAVIATAPLPVGKPARSEPPPPPAAMRPRVELPGGSTLGFGTQGLPVPELPPPVPIPPRRAPLLIDVTPHTLGVETVSGFCESVIGRNAAIPVEQTRIFTTARDDQELVSVRIYQGESRRFEENQPLGHIELSGLRRAPRGVVQIGVTFSMDADGTLGVSARDLETGREEKVRINLLGGVGQDDIQRMAERQAKMLAAR